MVGWLAFLPQGILRRLMGKRMAKLLPPRSTETALIHALFAELMYYRLTKADILGIFWRTIDYATQKYTPQDLAAWPGKVLLVMADDDPGTPEAVRTAMLALYPGASQHLFHGSGHTTALTREAEYQAVLDTFFAEAA
jgi:pimeloyl-ACP methyl ester carboxylesterase